MTKPYMLTDSDAATVKAILLTHATMQDHRAIESMQLLGRLRHDEPDDELIPDLQGQVNDFEADTQNLERIAEIFN